ncbi:SDR family oxidoreductase [Paraburkholderia sediminicola]|nr:SDR family oxidoreductase [Paraburkholderia sediminicola]
MRCGHRPAKEVVTKEEMVDRVKAAVDARTDESLVIMARTDAAAAEGIDAAIERAVAYMEAGADMVFPAGRWERRGNSAGHQHRRSAFRTQGIENQRTTYGAGAVMKDNDSLFSVAGKVALVSGATSGIGLMMARSLVGGGARVYAVARNPADCKRVADELTELGECRALPGDLSSLAGIKSVVSALAGQESRLNILINNAGIHKIEPIDEFSEASWDDTTNLNLKAAFFMVQNLLPLLRNAATAADPACIVNVGSGHGLRVPRFENYAYQASKAGIHHLTRSLAGRLAREHITVNAIAPGVFPSRITEGFSDATVKTISDSVPLGRYGESEDIAGVIRFLCSRAGAYVSATILPVDGGWAGVG